MRDLKSILVGQSETHLADWEDRRKVHSDMIKSLTALRDLAKKNGFELKVASAFRSFDRQVELWNAKAKTQPLSEILRWLALPGTSRHHWGTDIDVYDSGSVPADYKLQLTLMESDSIFQEFHRWLDGNMKTFGFFRPYAKDNGGVNREPWHLSYAPVSEVYFEQYSYELLEDTLQLSEIALKEAVLENLPEIYATYVRNITAP